MFLNRLQFKTKFYQQHFLFIFSVRKTLVTKLPRTGQLYKRFFENKTLIFNSSKFYAISFILKVFCKDLQHQKIRFFLKLILSEILKKKTVKTAHFRYKVTPVDGTFILHFNRKVKYLKWVKTTSPIFSSYWQLVNRKLNNPRSPIFLAHQESRAWNGKTWR